MLKLPLSLKALIFYRQIENIDCEFVYKNLRPYLGVDFVKLNTKHGRVQIRLFVTLLVPIAC